MLSRLDLRGQTLTTAELRRILPRGGTDIDHVLGAVTPVVEAVRPRAGQPWVRQNSILCVRLRRVPAGSSAAACQLDPNHQALADAISQVRTFHATLVRRTPLWSHPAAPCRAVDPGEPGGSVHARR